MVDRSGEQIGPYRLKKRLGYGGFANVYLGQHIYLQREAAIKLLTTELDEDQLQEFLAEARTLTALDHPHIIKLIDFNIQDGVPYLVMEYAPRGSLRTLYPRNSILPLETVVALISQIADALYYAHERNIIHRDVKPENMLINAQGKVLVGDFGISVIAQTTNPLEDQDTVGTPTYMAPEQLLGKPRRASDQYALATVAYEWLCGQPPFIGDTVSVAMQQIHNDPPLLSDFNPKIPRKVVAVVMRALKKQPEQRYPNIHTFATALQEASGLPSFALPGDKVISLASTDVQSGQSTPHKKQSLDEDNTTVAEHLSIAAPDALTEHSEQPGKDFKHRPITKNRNRLLIIATAITLIAILTIGILIQLPTTLMTIQRDQQATATAQAIATATVAPYATATAVAQAFQQHVEQHGIRFGFDNTHSGYNPYEQVLNRENVTQLVQHWTFEAGGAIFSSPIIANGIIYFGSDDKKLHAIDLATQQEHWSFSAGDVVSSPAYHDGTIYIGSNDDYVYALDARTGAKHWSFKTGSNVLSTPVIANGLVFVGSADYNLYALDAQTGTKRWSQPTGFIISSSPSVAHGLVFVGSWDQRVHAFNAETGTKSWDYYMGDIVHASPTIIDNTLYIGALNRKFVALDVQTGSAKWTFETNGIIVSSSAVTNGIVYVGTGRHLLYAIDAQTGKQIWVFTTTGEVNSSPMVANGVVYIGSNDNNLYAIDSHNGKELWHFAADDDISSSPMVANGMIYVGSKDMKLYAYGLPK